MLRSIDNVEEIQNNSSGPGYIYFETNIDFSDVISLVNIDVIRGQNNNNTFTGGITDENVEGGGGNDTLRGNDGDDTLKGQNGDDHLDGGKGANLLYGGAGTDRFYVTHPEDNSSIFDFTSGETIEFDSLIADDFSDLTITDVSGDAHITVGLVDITLVGYDHALLGPGDFYFA